MAKIYAYFMSFVEVYGLNALSEVRNLLFGKIAYRDIVLYSCSKLLNLMAGILKIMR